MILAQAANIARDQKKHPKAFEPDEFNPYAERGGAKRKTAKRTDIVKLTPDQSVKALANVFGPFARSGRRMPAAAGKEPR